ncbi:MAG: hypothetical protein U0791_05210 [Gemmataceae bacterium]
MVENSSANTAYGANAIAQRMITSVSRLMPSSKLMTAAERCGSMRVKAKPVSRAVNTMASMSLSRSILNGFAGTMFTNVSMPNSFFCFLASSSFSSASFLYSAMSLSRSSGPAACPGLITFTIVSPITAANAVVTRK